MASYKVSETLKELRIHKHMTQEEISKQLNMSRQVYSYYESGRRLPDLDTACRMAAYHHISLDQLVITGLHPDPVNVNPFASLPPEYQKVMQSYHNLSAERQERLKEYMEYLEYLDKKKKK